MRHRSIPLTGLVCLPIALAASLGVGPCQPAAGPDPADLSSYTVVQIAPGPNFEARARTAFTNAEPGTILELPAGTYDFQGSLIVDASHVVVRGQGRDAPAGQPCTVNDACTVLDFTGQQSGAQGILARGDYFVVQDLAIINPAGDGVKTDMVTGATFERIKVEWTNASDPVDRMDNGAYGLYPALNTHVLVDDCVVIGSRDAGIYVGQSKNVIIRNSFVEWNVLGIEVENSTDADVHDNVATNNTGGIAVFNLPDLIEKDGRRARVFNNTIYDNDTLNFAAGGILANVPGGTGIILIGAKDVEIFNNTVYDNDTTNLFIAGFDIAIRLAGEILTDTQYDKYVETVYVHDNSFSGGGTNPRDPLGQAVSIFSFPIPDITIGGWFNPAKVPGVYDPTVFPGTPQIDPALRVCIQDNGAATFMDLNRFANGSTPSTDLSPHDCTHAPLPAIVIPPTPAPPTSGGGLTPEEMAAICALEQGPGINWDAVHLADCDRLSSYRLFVGDVRSAPNGSGIEYDLTMPLFSDYALKDRFLFLPPGGQAVYSPDEVFDLPVGTVIAKTFSFRNDSVDPPTETVVETRLLIHRESGWDGLTYVHDAQAGDAFLTVGGAFHDVTLTTPAGERHTTSYEIPSRADCGSCHFGDRGVEPIGIKARYLNRTFDYPEGSKYQLMQLAERGLLAYAPATSDEAPALPLWSDPTTPETLEARARAYLEANCAHCHNPEGRAGFTGLWLQHDAPIDTHYGICKRPVAAGGGAVGAWDIVPGDSASSILVNRLDSADAAIKMPELAKSLVHREGVELVAEWIDSLPGDCNP